MFGQLRKNFSTPDSMGALKYDDHGLYHKFEEARDGDSGHHSHRRSGVESLEAPAAVGTFSRASSLADVAYVAAPGITSRVSRNGSVVSLANLSDAFSDMPGHESPVFISTSPTARLLLSTFVALQSTLTVGYNLGNMNTPAHIIRASLGIPSVAFTVDGVAVPMAANDALWGFAVSIFFLGALVGCNSSPQLADKWGRKTYLLWNSAVFIVGALLEAGAQLPQCTMSGGWEPCLSRVAMLITGRGIAGIASGGATAVVPLYLGEVAPAHLRGMLGSANYAMTALGICMAQVFGIARVMGTIQRWPYMLAFPVIPAFLQLLLQPLLLESPRWYALLGNDLMAEAMLAQIRGRAPNDAELQEELYCMILQAQKHIDRRSDSASSVSSRPQSRTSSFSLLPDRPPSSTAPACPAAASAAAPTADCSSRCPSLRDETPSTQHSTHSSALPCAVPAAMPTDAASAAEPPTQCTTSVPTLCNTSAPTLSLASSRTGSPSCQNGVSIAAAAFAATPAGLAIKQSEFEVPQMPSIFASAVANPALRRALLVCCVVTVVQQCSGVSNVIFFSSTIFERHGLDDDSCALIAVAMSTSNVVVALASAALMDTVGRRWLLLGSLGTMIIALVLLTLTLSLPLTSWVPVLLAICLSLFVGGFAAGLGTVPTLLPLELFPAKSRSTGCAIVASLTYTTRFFVTQAFLGQASSLGHCAFLPHIAALVLGLLFCFCSMPETRGKSLETIERELMSGC